MDRARQLKLVNASQDGQSELARIEQAAAHLSADARQALGRVLAFIEPVYRDAHLATGEPALAHALGTAGIVAELKLDVESIGAAMLAPVTAVAPSRLTELRGQFGSSVSELAEGVARMAEIGALVVRPGPGRKPEQHAGQLESLRKMLLAMVQDIRVVLVKLASHAQDLRYLVKSGDEAARHEAAQLALDVFAPLANRLGVWQLKWELEDLAFRILEPATYKSIAQQLDGKREDRERYIQNVINLLGKELARAGIEAEITGRPKHIYSIYKKLRRKGTDFEALYDVRAVRVLTRDVKDCYAVLGHVHNLWTPFPKEFDDYIAKPKSNHYRSLHTAVIGPEDKAVEVQIRTLEMHQHSELGVAAHWRYKEGLRHDLGFDEKIAWLRQILEWKDEVPDAGELAEQFRTGLFEDTIYVLTPQGRVISLPRGATAVDFAYQVHTELGHRCRGARVNGQMLPLDTALENGQQVEIVSAKQGGPSRDWLNPALGYVRSGSARAKIRQWFHRQNLEAEAAQGRTLVEKELQRQGMTGLGLDRLAHSLGYARLQDFLAEVGRADIGPRQLQNAVRALDPRAAPAAPAEEAPVLPVRTARPARAGGSVLVVGVDKLLTVPAKCCKPAPPDAIIGFVTRGRGVTVHRAACANVRRLDPERRVTAEWGESTGSSFPVDIEVEAADRTGLLRDISDVFSRERINVTATSAASRETAARMRFTIEVSDIGQLARSLALIREVRGVTRAARR